MNLDSGQDHNIPSRGAYLRVAMLCQHTHPWHAKRSDSNRQGKAGKWRARGVIGPGGALDPDLSLRARGGCYISRGQVPRPPCCPPGALAWCLHYTRVLWLENRQSPKRHGGGF